MSGLSKASVTARGAAISLVFLALVGHAPAARAQARGDVWAAPERAALRPNPVIATSDAVGRGHSLFHQSCESCHGFKGHGDGSMATSLPIKPSDLSSERVQSQTDGALFWKLNAGRGMMLSTQGTMTDEQRWAVVDYIRTLAAKHP